MKIFWIDLFAGAGGTTTGIHMAKAQAEVVACVNHDATAISSHKANHPNCIHYTEDIRDFKVVLKLQELVSQLREEHPHCLINIWASLECTNYSKAKGGLPRDVDSRTLAEHLFMYLEELHPNYLFIENVEEFMSWGPLDENGKPISRKNGIDYIKWVKNVKNYGFEYNYKILNAANYGAYTSRKRYFAQFANKNLPIQWPKATHAQNPQKADLFQSSLQPWKAVKDVLDLYDKGTSIFEPGRIKSNKTFERIYNGLEKFVAQGDTEFLTSYYGNGSAHSMQQPCPTVTTKDRFSKIKTDQFLDQQYGTGVAASIEKPANTITTNPKLSLVSAQPWLMNTAFNNVGSPLNSPCPTITASRHYHYIMNPQFNSKGSSIEQPCPTVIARQDKRPLYLISAQEGKFNIPIYSDDSEIVIKIKKFMALYGITDIKMRMLKINELKKIQGFPETYILQGNKAQQKKQLGNAVECTIASKIIEANWNANQERNSSLSTSRTPAKSLGR